MRSYLYLGDTMFASRFHYEIDSDKQIAKISPTSGTIVKWVVFPTLLSILSLIPLFWPDTPISVLDNLDEALSEEEQK
jgi:hypothetical protein